MVNVQALFSGPDNPTSVDFALTGPSGDTYVHTEQNAPYYFLGDSNGVPNGWNTAIYPYGSYSMTITAHQDHLSCGTQTFSLTIPEADLQITKTAPPVANVGGTITYTIAVKNNGPDAARNVVMSDTLPLGVSFQTATWDKDGSPQVCDQAGGVVTCNLGDLAVQQTVNITLSVTADAVGAVSNTALVAADSPRDLVAENNASTAETTVNAPCVPNPRRDLSARIERDSSNPNLWHGIVTNRSAGCSYEVGMASYRKFQPNVLSDQELYDSDPDIQSLGLWVPGTLVHPGETVVLTVEAPACAARLEVFFDANHLGSSTVYDLVPLVLPEFRRTDLYGPYGGTYDRRQLRVIQINGTQWCSYETSGCTIGAMSIQGVSDGQTVSGVVNIQAVFAGLGIIRPSKVEFVLTAPTGHTYPYADLYSPYYYRGDNNGHPKGWNTRQYPIGLYRLTVTAYRGQLICAAQTLSFTVRR